MFNKIEVGDQVRVPTSQHLSREFGTCIEKTNNSVKIKFSNGQVGIYGGFTNEFDVKKSTKITEEDKKEVSEEQLSSEIIKSKKK